jgi:hypothetical protein
MMPGVLRRFIASCKRRRVEPFARFHEALSRVPAHSEEQSEEKP